MENSLGKLFTVTSFGESHGQCLGAVIDGSPAGLAITKDDIQQELDQRKPDSAITSTERAELDRVEILSGISDGITTGAPICLIIWNRDVDSTEYERARFLPRPSHADYPAFVKYGGFNDFRGGGRFSGRLTAVSVMGGAIAKKILKLVNIEIIAHTINIGGITAASKGISEIKQNRPQNPLKCADPEVAGEMAKLIEAAKQQGDSLGGIIEGIAINVPVGLGEPVFGRLDSELAKALFAIPAVKGVEFGAGFSAANKRGSQNNDPIALKDSNIVTTTNNAGGILGGISNGMPIVVRVAVKPTASITEYQSTVNMKTLKSARLTIKGRHDACIVPRAVVVVESMMAITLTDLAMRAGFIPRVIK
ncbi:MAG: chorismate synthase [Dehalococcoidales bacterium]|nr:chorismate synthase [Dehalococcoidales bacterium]